MIIVNYELNSIQATDLEKLSKIEHASPNKEEKEACSINFFLDQSEKGVNRHMAFVKHYMKSLRILWTKLSCKMRVSERCLIFTVPPLMPQPLKIQLDSFLSSNSSSGVVKILTRASLAAHFLRREVCTVVDVRDECSWISTQIEQRQVHQGLQRISVGSAHFVESPDKSHEFDAFKYLFAPHLLGINQMGLTESILQSISAFTPALKFSCLANVVLIGCFDGMDCLSTRIQDELKGMLPHFFDIQVVSVHLNDLCYSLATDLDSVMHL